MFYVHVAPLVSEVPVYVYWQVCQCVYIHICEHKESKLCGLSFMLWLSSCSVYYTMYQGRTPMFQSCPLHGVFFFFLNRKSSHDKKSQDFGNLFSFPSYSQKSEDGMHTFVSFFTGYLLYSQYVLVLERKWQTNQLVTIE